jgi:uncharacterized protein YjiS (DUF1127 family)
MTNSRFYDRGMDEGDRRNWPEFPSFAEDMRTLWDHMIQRHQRRRLIGRAARLTPHMLCDIGLDLADTEVELPVSSAPLRTPWRGTGHF